MNSFPFIQYVNQTRSESHGDSLIIAITIAQLDKLIYSVYKISSPNTKLLWTRFVIGFLKQKWSMFVTRSLKKLLYSSIAFRCYNQPITKPVHIASRWPDFAALLKSGPSHDATRACRGCWLEEERNGPRLKLEISSNLFNIRTLIP